VAMSVEIPESFGEVLDFMRLVWAVSHGLEATSKRMDRTLGITGPQRLVVRILGKLPGVSVGNLAAVLQLHPSTLTGVVQRLQARGLIHRDTAPGDRRRARLYLTGKGRRFDIVMNGTVEAAVARALSQIPRRDMRTVQGVLNTVAASLGVPPQPRGPQQRALQQ
jgi:DNA-binding MarR family transcriptional regulator